MTFPTTAIYTDGPHYAPNRREIVDVLYELPDPPYGRFRCRFIYSKEEFTCFGSQLDFSDLGS